MDLNHRPPGPEPLCVARSIGPERWGEAFRFSHMVLRFEVVVPG
jgi:hypothetical protein